MMKTKPVSAPKFQGTPMFLVAVVAALRRVADLAALISSSGEENKDLETLLHEMQLQSRPKAPLRFSPEAVGKPQAMTQTDPTPETGRSSQYLRSLS